MFELCWKLLKPMAEIIPDQILDAALKEIANFSDAEARAEIDRISVVQPAWLNTSLR